MAKNLSEIRVVSLTFILLAMALVQVEGANIDWDLPRPVIDDNDVITCGSLNRAYALSYGTNITVNGVLFARLDSSIKSGNGTEDLSLDQSLFAVSGDKDSLSVLWVSQGEVSRQLSLEYNILLRSGLYNEGYACALVLKDLTRGKKYLFQAWLRDPENSNSAQSVSAGNNISQLCTPSRPCLVGTFVADSTNQNIILNPNAGRALINAFQLRTIDSLPTNSAIIKQPCSITNRIGEPTGLAILACAESYQWQKVTSEGTIDLFDNSNVVGVKSASLHFKNLSMTDSGTYRVIVSNAWGSIISSNAFLGITTNQLINFAVMGWDPITFMGTAVLPGSPKDFWNSCDGQKGFTNVSLADAAGTPTPITVTLEKTDGGGATHNFLGGVSYGTNQTVTINNLIPNALYNLVVFSVGDAANEGGVFSGCIEGMSKGYAQKESRLMEFCPGTNYVQNPFARANSEGKLIFQIAPNASVLSKGHFHTAFNGFQLMEVSVDQYGPVFVQQPSSAYNYPGNSVGFNAIVGNPSTNAVYYQWQISRSNICALLEDGDDHVKGANSNVLIIARISSEHCGDYQLVASNSFGTVTSHVAKLYLLTNQLINVVMCGESPSDYHGIGVLRGASSDHWQGIDAREAFTDVSLKDSQDNTTSVRVSLEKNDGTATAHPLLGGISYASKQTLKISGLIPNAVYDFVVFSVGGEANEGGVFSGAVNGMSRGYPVRGVNKPAFEPNITYVRNPHAIADSRGRLMISIKPNSSVLANGYFNCDINGFQLQRISSPNQRPIIAEQPVAKNVRLSHPESLNVVAVGPDKTNIFYQWQKITAGKAANITDTAQILGTKANVLQFRAFAAEQAGDYRVVASNSFGCVTSSVASITVDTNMLLINVAASGAKPAGYKGTAVLGFGTEDVWNNVNCRNGVKNASLLDSTGAETPVTLTVTKEDGDAIPHPLLGGISYSKSHTIIINNLLPNQLYDLVVYSVGMEANEGGVFSGSINGIARGYSRQGVVPEKFEADVNYVENHFARSDSFGQLTFTIKPNATMMANGYFNGDFNGFQLLEGF